MENFNSGFGADTFGSILATGVFGSDGNKEAFSIGKLGFSTIREFLRLCDDGLCEMFEGTKWSVCKLEILSSGSLWKELLLSSRLEKIGGA